MLLLMELKKKPVVSKKKKKKGKKKTSFKNNINNYYKLYNNYYKVSQEQEKYNKNHFELLEEKNELDRLYKLEKNKLEKERINKIINELSKNNKATAEDVDKYLDNLDDEKLKSKEEYDKKLNRMSELYGVANNNNLNIFSSDYKLGTRNSRIFVILGHGSLKSKYIGKEYGTPSNDWLQQTFTRFNYRSENDYRLMTYQSVGRYTVYSETYRLLDKYRTLVHETFTSFIVNLFKDYPDFYRTFIETDTDGDTQNLDKLFTRFFENKGITPNMKRLQTKMKSRFTSEFKIYPKKNKAEEDLNNEPPNKNFYFSTILNNKLDPAGFTSVTQGIVELTKMNKYGYYEVDDFMLSEPLQRTFTPQCIRASSKLEKIAACLRIPDEETVKFIKRVHGEAYLEKLNKMNSMNRKLFDMINPDFSTTLVEDIIGGSLSPVIKINDIHPITPFLNENDEIIINPGKPNEEKVIVNYSFVSSPKTIKLKKMCLNNHKAGTTLLINKKNHNDTLLPIQVYRLIDRYVNQTTDLNNNIYNSNSNNNREGDDILILDSTCNTIDPTTIERITKQEHSKILNIFSKHGVKTSKDLNDIIKYKTNKKKLKRLKKEFHKQKVKNLGYWTEEKLMELLDFYNDRFWNQRAVFPGFYEKYYEKELKRSDSSG